MKKHEKKHYESPKLTAVTFRAERGYASSERDGFLQIIIGGDPQGSENLESRTSSGSYWGGSDSWF
jgi:hypothetical protein